MDQRSALFSRREIREYAGWSSTQIRRHLEHLIELECIQARGGCNGVLIQYVLLGDAAEEGAGFQVGLIDVAKLRKSKPTTPTLPKIEAPCHELAKPFGKVVSL